VQQLIGVIASLFLMFIVSCIWLFEFRSQLPVKSELVSIVVGVVVSIPIILHLLNGNRKLFGPPGVALKRSHELILQLVIGLFIIAGIAVIMAIEGAVARRFALGGSTVIFCVGLWGFLYWAWYKPMD
jgi:hypothetical protein